MCEISRRNATGRRLLEAVEYELSATATVLDSTAAAADKLKTAADASTFADDVAQEYANNKKTKKPTNLSSRCLVNGGEV